MSLAFGAAAACRRNLGKIHRMFAGNRIEMEAILADLGEYLMIFRPTMIKPDFGGRLPAGCRCLYSYWSGYVVRPEWADLKARLDTVGGDFIECHTSGHIFADDIVRFVKAIGPRMVVPIHTQRPDIFAKKLRHVRVLNDAQTFTLAE